MRFRFQISLFSLVDPSENQENKGRRNDWKFVCTCTDSTTTSLLLPARNCAALSLSSLSLRSLSLSLSPLSLSRALFRAPFLLLSSFSSFWGKDVSFLVGFDRVLWISKKQHKKEASEMKNSFFIFEENLRKFSKIWKSRSEISPFFRGKHLISSSTDGNGDGAALVKESKYEA